MIKLIICETASSTWNYHLRLIEDGQEKCGGMVDGHALCDSKIGWDTKIPLSAYGKSIFPDHWCSKCLKIARDLRLPGEEKIKNIILIGK